MRRQPLYLAAWPIGTHFQSIYSSLFWKMKSQQYNEKQTTWVPSITLLVLCFSHLKKLKKNTYWPTDFCVNRLSFEWICYSNDSVIYKGCFSMQDFLVKHHHLWTVSRLKRLTRGITNPINKLQKDIILDLPHNNLTPCWLVKLNQWQMLIYWQYYSVYYVLSKPLYAYWCVCNRVSQFRLSGAEGPAAVIQHFWQLVSAHPVRT